MKSPVNLNNAPPELDIIKIDERQSTPSPKIELRLDEDNKQRLRENWYQNGERFCQRCEVIVECPAAAMPQAVLP